MAERQQFRHQDGMTSIICYGERPSSARPLFAAIAGSAAASFTVSLMLLLGTGYLERPAPGHATHSPALVAAPEYDHLSKEAIYQKLIEADEPFKAIAVLLEDIRTEVYYDSGGRNIGAGYLLSKQIASKGRSGVIAELTAAGVPITTAMTLTDPHSSDRDKVTITKGQAIKLLSINQIEYERAASRWLGSDVYTDLGASQQAAVAYLAYNVGATKLSKFTALKKAIRQDRGDMIEKHLKVSYRDASGRVIENKRVGTVLQSAFLNADESVFVPGKLAQHLAMNNN